ncbi:MAG: GDSL-type esterase/lipase family protein [Candidatus Eiseniibacteriota bacterium]
MSRLCRGWFAQAFVCALLAAAPSHAWDWDGAAWADYRAFLGPIDAATKARLQAVVTAGAAAGRIEGRMGQVGDSITESSAFFRNAVLNGVTSNGTLHDYAPIRSWLAYSGTQPADPNSFYRDHGKGAAYGNLGGWEVAEAVAAGHPPAGIEVGDGVTPGEWSWAIVMFGTNDIDNGAWDAASWKEAMRAFAQGTLDLGVVPVLSTIPPELAHAGDGRVEAANAAVMALAGEMRVPWIDFHGLVLQHQPVNWVGTLISNDGTHPTAGTGGRGFSQTAQTLTDGYALRTKLAFDAAEKLRDIVFEDGVPDPGATAAGQAAGQQATAAGGVGALGMTAAPNPFRGTTMLSFDLAAGAAVQIDIVDVRGRRVRSAQAPAWLAPGRHARAWDGRDDAGRAVAGGMYFAVLRGAGPPRSGPVVVVR